MLVIIRYIETSDGCFNPIPTAQDSSTGIKESEETFICYNYTYIKSRIPFWL